MQPWSFDGRFAVVTGAGTGMGRELVVQLAAAGCSVAGCDIHTSAAAETAARAAAGARGDARVTAHTCDVADEAQVIRFRDEVLQLHDTDCVHLMFNNAGIYSSTSFVNGDRVEWDRVFAVCWTGTYNCSRAFVPLLVAADAGCLVNTSSVNGFWANPTSYSAAKFAVKGFTEALIGDFQQHAPHVTAALVMPGAIGTDILTNSRNILADVDAPSGDDAAAFRAAAPVSAAEAATFILDSLRAGEWRILVGADARMLDERLRSDPLGSYGPDGITLSDLRE